MKIHAWVLRATLCLGLAAIGCGGGDDSGSNASDGGTSGSSGKSGGSTGESGSSSAGNSGSAGKGSAGNSGSAGKGGSSSSSMGSSGFVPGPHNKLIPAPPTDPSHVHDICVTQINEDGPGQSGGMVCGNNPNFTDEWSSSVPSTCLGIKGCTSMLGGVTYKGPPSVSFQVTAGFPVGLTAVILNCLPSANVNYAAGCILSNDSASIPTSHKISWDKPNGNTGPSTTMTITQIATSDATPLMNNPPAQWPGSDVLIYDDYGNAVIFALGVTTCSGMCE
jgi:hypothetical protein